MVMVEIPTSKHAFFVPLQLLPDKNGGIIQSSSDSLNLKDLA
jgi:hypothetical protein